MFVLLIRALSRILLKCITFCDGSRARGDVFCRDYFYFRGFPDWVGIWKAGRFCMSSFRTPLLILFIRAGFRSRYSSCFAMRWLSVSFPAWFSVFGGFLEAPSIDRCVIFNLAFSSGFSLRLSGMPHGYNALGVRESLRPFPRRVARGSRTDLKPGNSPPSCMRPFYPLRRDSPISFPHSYSKDVIECWPISKKRRIIRRKKGTWGSKS